MENQLVINENLGWGRIFAIFASPGLVSGLEFALKSMFFHPDHRRHAPGYSVPAVRIKPVFVLKGTFFSTVKTLDARLF